MSTTKLGDGTKITTLDSSKRAVFSDADGKQYYMIPADEANELMKLMPEATNSLKGLMPSSYYNCNLTFTPPFINSKAVRIGSFKPLPAYSRDSITVTYNGFGYYAQFAIIASRPTPTAVVIFNTLEIAKQASSYSAVKVLIVSTGNDNYDVYVTGCYASNAPGSRSRAECGGQYSSLEEGSVVNVSSLTVFAEFTI